MSKCIVLVGGTCSGKTFVLNELRRRGVKRIITYTTRPMRPGEVDGVDYHFITKESFKQKFVNDFFAEFTTYTRPDGRIDMYGSAAKDYKNSEGAAIILDPIGVANITIPAFVVHLDMAYSIKEKRSRARGECPVEFYNRWRTDEIYLDKMRETRDPDLIIKRSYDVSKMVDRILRASTIW